MKIALIAPPFISVPPPRYGGTELHLAHLALGLRRRGHHPVVYTNGESRLKVELRYLYPRSEWPIHDNLHSSLKDLNHSSWACREAADCDLIHLHNAPGLAFTRFFTGPVAYTLHHPWEPALAEFYRHFPDVHFIAISQAQSAAYRGFAHLHVVPHGIDLNSYRLGGGRREWLVFLGRIAPIKGVHLAIEVARRAGLPLKIAGEIQPIFREYWERQIRPQLDGRIQYVGEVGLEEKNALLGGALAMLFPIEWEEPFGLVMLEAMACGAPVLAFPRGAAPEVIAPGVSGWLCRDVAEMARRAAVPGIAAESCRAWVAARFSLERMVADYERIYCHMLAATSQALTAESDSSFRPKSQAEARGSY